MNAAFSGFSLASRLLQKSSSAFAQDVALAFASNTQVGFQAAVLLICF